MNDRIRLLLKTLNTQNVDIFIVSNIFNIRYLSDFSGSNGLLVITGEKSVFFTDPRYNEQAFEEAAVEDIIISGECLYTNAAKWISKNQKKTFVGFEEQHISYSANAVLSENLPGYELKPFKNIVEKQAQIKDDKEISLIRTCCEISDKAFDIIIDYIKPGVSERDLAAELVYQILKNGGEKLPFDPIVLSGERSSMIHGKPSDRKICTGDFVLMDYGAVYGGYSSDITRTVSVGMPSRRQREIWNTVKAAQQKAVEMLKAGVIGADVHSTAADVIAARGFHEYFTHSLGHGIGLDVHSLPLLSIKNEEQVPENSVVTVEPGIYIPGFGGVRIEDDYLVKNDGAEVLSRAPHIMNVD